MNESKKIIVGQSSQISVYYNHNGMFLENLLSVGGSYLYENLDDYRFIEVDRQSSMPCFELNNNAGAMRLNKYLGRKDINKYTETMRSKDKAETLIIYDKNETDEQLLLKNVIELIDIKTKIIYIILSSNSKNTILDFLVTNHLDNLLVITNADVLRRRGMDIAYGLSWESTVSDLLWQAFADITLSKVAKKGNLIVRFATEGALWFGSDNNDETVTLQFIPHDIEGDQLRKQDGFLYDNDALFAKPIIPAFESGNGITDALKNGIQDVHICNANGYMIEDNKIENIIDDNYKIDIQKVNLTLDCMNKRPGYVWSLLVDDETTKLEHLAKNIILHGIKELEDIPSARFGYLVTVDRNEIERYRAIRNLMEEYLNTKNPKRPLSIAVFGKPGSGKSFGVTQIANCLDPNKITKVEFNLSQMQTNDELMRAFERVQDLVLDGKIPLVFFDEFDSDRDGVALGWLKSFLAPMQDGAFNHNGIHPIGKCIFIFAGGVFTTFDDFGKEQDNTRAKVRDFISRLRGYVNIQGPNPLDDKDESYIIRRAVLIRSLIERKLRKIIAKDGLAQIDEDIIRAMLKVPSYRHGVRSIEAIIDMSMLAGKRYWDKSSLPPVAQLTIHVDSILFKHLLLVKKLLASYREEIAQSIHKNYLISLEKQEERKDNMNPNNCIWGELNEEFKEENRLQADDFIGKLFLIDCSIEPIGVSSDDFTLTEEEIEFLAKAEHIRWMQSKQKGGWIYGNKKDIEKKISPYMVSWSELDEDARNLDRDPIRNISNILKDTSIGIYRIK